MNIGMNIGMNNCINNFESKFLIIDGNSLGCRAAFAHNPKHGEDLCNFEGRPTGATYRFFNMLDRILHQIRPTHVVVAWDTNSNTFRKQIYPEYKANRKQSTADNETAQIQFEDIKNILNLIGINNVNIEGFEGDDIVGSYTELSTADKDFIVTGDKDSFQLVTDNAFIIYPLNGFKEVQIINPQYIENKYNIEVDKFIDLKALMGDTGDNIKGINGCGEKTALKLLEKLGSAKAVSEYKENELEGINKKVMCNLKEWSDRFEQTMQLVTIRKDVDLPYTFEECEIDLQWENAKEYFKQLTLNSFLRKINNKEFFGQL